MSPPSIYIVRAEPSIPPQQNINRTLSHVQNGSTNLFQVQHISIESKIDLFAFPDEFSFHPLTLFIIQHLYFVKTIKRIVDNKYDIGL